MMPDFRLRVFYYAAKHLSFTQAAQELYVSQPSITRHIKNLEDEFKVRLFERHGSSIELTAAGKIMQQYAERILLEYHNLKYEMHLLHNEHVGQLAIGSSTTITQYVLPSFLASFIKDFPLADISMINGNSRFIERALDNHDIDLGMVEGISRLPTFTYTPFLDDELIVLCSAHNKVAYKGSLSIEEFKTMPFVMRERGSGSLEVIERELLRNNMRLSELKVILYLGSTEAIKLFMSNSDGLCILSKNAVKHELADGSLIKVKVDGLSFKRTFCFVQSQGPQTPLVSRFMDFIMKQCQQQANN